MPEVNEGALEKILKRLHEIAVEEEEKLIFTKEEAERIKKEYGDEHTKTD